MSGLKRKATSTASAIPQLAKRSRRSVYMKDEIDHLRHCGELLEAIRSRRTADNRLLCESFIRAPSRRSDPEYFNVVSQPIDLTRIQQKVKTEEYRSVDELYADIHLLVSNNKKYYKEGSQEYKDACDLWDFFDARRKKLAGSTINDVEPSPSTRSTRLLRTEERSGREGSSDAKDDEVELSLLEEVLASTLELTDETGRLLSPPFRVLLPPEEFPAYYARIKKPIDLKQISEKARAGHYQTWAEFDADFRLMCKNAKVFNETGSIINKDATSLLRHYTKRKAELCEPDRKPLSPRKISANARLVDELLAQSASDGAAENYSEDSEEDEDTEKSEDPKWLLYWAIRNEPNPADPDSNLADPFLELPSKNWYPDYYDEISTPMSLFMINKKLKRGEYESLDTLLEDITLVFENARSYNLEGSEIYDAAVKLGKLAVSKARSLQPNLTVVKSESDTSSNNAARGSTRRGQKHRGMRARRAKSAKIKLEDDTAATTPSPSRSPLPKGSPLTVAAASGSSSDRCGRPGRKTMHELQSRYRDKLSLLWNAAYNFMDGNRRVIDAFMVLPSKHEYPQYYDVIEKPIDMATIKKKVEEDQYESSDEFMADITLLFSNAQTFNEPGSQIYRDSSTLEAVVRATLASIPDTPLFNPIHLKAKYGWLRTKLPPRERARPPPTGERILALRDQDDERELPRGTPTPTRGSGGGLHSASGSSSKLSSSFNATVTNSARHVNSSSSITNIEHEKQVDLFSLIKNYKDARGRNLAAAFLELPSKLEYPDYYDVIRKPIDLAKIGSRISSHHYDSVDALCSDFILMFDNACRYNEPESTIYKDALSLQKVVLQKKRELCKGNSSVVNVQSEIRTLLTSLLIAVNNHQDRDGRCYSDSLAEVPSLLRKKGIKPNDFPFSLDEMRKNIDKGRYRRLDRFQDDLFALFDAARQNSRSDSQLFEDAVELQMHYVKVRDELTRNTLISPARFFTERKLLVQVDELRRKKIPEESAADNANAKEQTLGQKAEGDVDLDTVGQGGCVYRVRDYAYIAAASDEAATRRHIMRIERLYKDCDGHMFARGIWCYRPEETFHLATRKFIENEVFLTPYFDTVTVDRLIGKCHVMFIRHYLKEKPKGFDEKDVYVCESRYMGRQLHFKKMKQWPYKDEEENVEYEKRPEPITQLSRVASVFVRQKPSEAHTSDMTVTENDDNISQNSSCSSAEDDRLKNLPPILHKHRVEVRVARDEDHHVSNNNEKSVVYYEQMEYNSHWYQLGDFVLVYNPLKNGCAILRIDRMWRTPEGDATFSGPYFARPNEVEHEPTRMFYKREVFAVEQPDVVVPMQNIQGHCFVLLLRDYAKMRPTEVDESEVYVVEYKVAGHEPPGNRCSLSKSDSYATIASTASPRTSTDDSTETAPDVNSPQTVTNGGDPLSESSARKLKTLKAYHLSAEVLEHEIYLFKTPIAMEKEMSPLLMHTDTSAVPMEPLDDMDETASESLDGLDHTPGKTLYMDQSQELVAWLAAQPKLNARSKSGYILFSAEIRKRIMQENPEAGFGEVSKIVGIEWKKLTEEQKKQYEVRAEYIASERAKQEAREPTHSRLQPGQIRVFMCKWQSCDFQFDNTDGLYDHIKTSHTSKIVDGENQYVCLWTSCLKYRKEGKPFPSLPRLHRHIKEKHLTTSAKSIYPNQRSKNFYSYQPVATTTGQTTTYVAVQQPTVQQLAQPYGVAQGQVSGYVTQAVVASGSQIVTNGYVNGTATAVAVAPTAYVATAAPATVVHAATPHGYHPYQQVRQLQVVSTAQPVTVTAQHYTAVPVQPVGYGAPSTSQQTTVVTDPGRTVVHAAKAVEPVFVAPPNSIQVKRVMHSEVYLKYIESLSNAQQRHVSKWNRSLLSNPRNTPPTQKPLPLQWLKDAKDNGARDEEIVKALWRLRDQLLESTVNIAREVDLVGPF
uniref:Protein polybromo-1 n=1 Tax=Ascaris suum TaxID=6253 RepID=F1KQ15_ASCSU